MKLLPSEKFSTSTFPKESLIRPKQLLNNLQTIMHDPGPRGHPKGGGSNETRFTKDTGFGVTLGLSNKIDILSSGLK